MPLEPRASWFSPKCVEAQQLTGHLGVKHCFGAGRESGTKSRQTLNTRYDLKITGVKVSPYLGLGTTLPVLSSFFVFDLKKFMPRKKKEGRRAKGEPNKAS